MIPKNIIIAGCKGVGKTTYGKNLASRLNRIFFDTDALIVDEFSFFNIKEIFLSIGEKKFREIERDCFTQAINDNRDKVISTGGGFFYFRDNLKLVTNNSFIIYLYLSPSILWDLNYNNGNLPVYLHNLNDSDSKQDFIDRVNIIDKNLKDISFSINIERFLLLDS